MSRNESGRKESRRRIMDNTGVHTGQNTAQYITDLKMTLQDLGALALEICTELSVDQFHLMGQCHVTWLRQKHRHTD
jgi:hypothetical protein